MRRKYIFNLLILFNVVIFSCSEDDLTPSERNDPFVYLVKKNSIDKINTNENTLAENYYDHTLNVEKATKNEDFIVVASSMHALYDQELEIFELATNSNYKVDITGKLNYLYNVETFWLNDIYINKDKLYVLGLKVDYNNNSDSVQLVEIDLNSKLITKSTLFKHENTAARKYIKYVDDENIYFNIADELLSLDLSSFDKPYNSTIKTSFHPNNIILNKNNKLHYFDLEEKISFILTKETFKKSSEKTLNNLKISSLGREKSVANINNTFIGLYLTKTNPPVGIYQYDYDAQKMTRMLEDKEINNIISEHGYFVIQSKMIEVANDKIIFYGQIFNEEKSSHENIVTVLNSDFKRIQSFNFEISNDEILDIL